MRRASLLAICLFLGACGGTSDRSALDDAADATAATTARFEMKFDLPPIDGAAEETFTMSGFFDFANEAGLVKGLDGGNSSAGDSSDTPLEMRILQRTVYERWLVKGKTYWVRATEERRRAVDPFEAVVPFPGGPTAPTEVLDLILRSSDEVRVLGEDEVRGTVTTRYRAAIHSEKLIDQLPADTRPAAQDREDWEDRVVNVEAWVDEESRLRRISFGETDAGEVFAATLDLYDFGVEVDVRPPPENEVISQEELDKLMGDAVFDETPGGTGYFCDSNKKDDRTCADLAEEICAEARRENPKEADEICAAVRKEFQ